MLTILMLGLGIIVFCMIVQCLMVTAVVRAIVADETYQNSNLGFFNLALHLSAVLIALLIGNLLQIAIWGGSFVLLGEFENFETAFYHSMVNFTSLGYGDLVMSKTWRLLGSMEALNGMFMLGLSTSVLYSVIRFSMQGRFKRKL